MMRTPRAKLRRLRGLTQAQVVAALGITQPRISDLVTDTLERYVAALGGQLRVEVEFPDPDDPQGEPLGVVLE